jgi:hypothetical protein
MVTIYVVEMEKCLLANPGYYIDEMEKCLRANPGHCVTQFQAATQHCSGRFTAGKTIKAAKHFARARMQIGTQKKGN